MLFSNTQLTDLNRYQAFAAHFALSFLVFLALTWAVFYIWYPGVFFETEKGWKALVLIAGVDLVLGPLLTLIVFNPVKKSLRMDLAIIALVQIGALVAGAYTIHTQRPVGLVVIKPKNGAQTLYARNLDSTTIAYINSRPQQVYSFQTTQAAHTGKDGKVAANAFSISQDNLIDFQSHQQPAKALLDNNQFRLEVDRGYKTDIFIITNDKGMIASH